MKSKVLLFMLVAVFLVSPAAIADTFTAFNNPSLWTTVIMGTGPSVTVVDSHTVDVTLAAGSTDPTIFLGELRSLTSVSGDFDYEVNYRLLSWPPTANGVRMGIRFIDGALERVSWENGVQEVYLTDLKGSIFSKPTDDLSGTLRLTRTGGTVTGYYLDGNTWVALGSFSSSTADTTFGLAAWSHPGIFNPNGQNVTVEFSSVPLPPTVLLLGSGLVGLLALGRRKRNPTP